MSTHKKNTSHITSASKSCIWMVKFISLTNCWSRHSLRHLQTHWNYIAVPSFVCILHPWCQLIAPYPWLSSAHKSSSVGSSAPTYLKFVWNLPSMPATKAYTIFVSHWFTVKRRTGHTSPITYAGTTLCVNTNARRAWRDCGSEFSNRLTLARNSVQPMEINVPMNLDWFNDVFRSPKSEIASFYRSKKKSMNCPGATNELNTIGKQTIPLYHSIGSPLTHCAHTNTYTHAHMQTHTDRGYIHADAHTHIGRTKWRMSEPKSTQTHNKWLCRCRRCAAEKVWYRSVDSATRLHNIRWLNLSSGIVSRASKIHDGENNLIHTRVRCEPNGKPGSNWSL